MEEAGNIPVVGQVPHNPLVEGIRLRNLGLHLRIGVVVYGTEVRHG